jgi:hypothetical protein
MTVSTSTNLKCILTNQIGVYQSDTTCYWTIVGSAATDISPSNTASIASTFTPSQLGSIFLVAFYAGTDNEVTGTVASTPPYLVQSNQVIQFITAYAGNSQTAIAGQGLAQPLQARVLDYSLHKPCVVVQGRILSGA